ncbi:hypothetical protein O181_082446 [Austropuccinia psidii MF-1]|uniref:Uncharacterized protein n=1 Tax=Austropuccinia psidii MF-1 TaxID=1389203 RepID=A0A9Q3FM40_9BASI|nr:hypothetical protein [Austropuccinia psidii MF-1]
MEEDFVYQFVDHKRVEWREEPPAGMETCAVSKLDYWKELLIEKESSLKNREILEETFHQILVSEEVKDSKDKVKIQKELAPMNEEDVNLNPTEENLPSISNSRKENGNSFSQISQAINSQNFKNTEEIRRKPLTKILSPIKALKSLSKGIFKDNLN